MLSGKTLMVDATTLEANAAMRSIVRRDTGESYQEYLTRLAKESGNRFAVALSLGQLAQLVWAKGDPTEARQLCRESIAVCRDQGDDWGLSATLNQLGNFEMMSGNEREAQQHLIEAVRVALRGEFHANVLLRLYSGIRLCQPEILSV